MTALPALFASLVLPLFGQDGHTLVLQDDAGIVAVSFDGTTSRTWQHGRMIGQARVDSWSAALWSVDIEPTGAVRTSLTCDRVLGMAELRILGRANLASAVPAGCKLGVPAN